VHLYIHTHVHCGCKRNGKKQKLYSRIQNERNKIRKVCLCVMFKGENRRDNLKNKTRVWLFHVVSYDLTRATQWVRGSEDLVGRAAKSQPHRLHRRHRHQINLPCLMHMPPWIALRTSHVFDTQRRNKQKK
jgi:hypothetical protein